MNDIDGSVGEPTFLVSLKQYPYVAEFSKCNFLSRSSPRSSPTTRCSASSPSLAWMFRKKQPIS